MRRGMGPRFHSARSARVAWVLGTLLLAVVAGRRIEVAAGSPGARAHEAVDGSCCAMSCCVAQAAACCEEESGGAQLVPACGCGDGHRLVLDGSRLEPGPLGGPEELPWRPAEAWERGSSRCAASRQPAPATPPPRDVRGAHAASRHRAA